MQNQGVSRATLSLRASGENSSLLLSGFWWLPRAFDVPWLVTALFQSLPPISHDLLSCLGLYVSFPFNIRIYQSLDLGLPLIQHDYLK